METGTRANVGVQYTFQSNAGGYLRAVFGQSFQLAGVNPYSDPGLDPTLKFNFNPTSGLQTDRSDYVAGVYLSPMAGLGLISQARFDERDWSLRRQDTGLTGSYGPLTGTVASTYTTFDPVTALLDRQHQIITPLALKRTPNWARVASPASDR